MNGDEYNGEHKRYGLSAQSHRWEVQSNYIVYLGGKTRVETSTMKGVSRVNHTGMMQVKQLYWVSTVLVLRKWRREIKKTLRKAGRKNKASIHSTQGE